MKNFIIVFYMLYGLSMHAMESNLTDLVKAWSQVNADIGYGYQFLEEHETVTLERKKNELTRFSKAWKQLIKHKNAFVGLQYGQKVISESNITKAVESLAEIHREIQDRPLRNPGEKRVVLPGNIPVNLYAQSNITFGSFNQMDLSTSRESSPDPSLISLFANSNSDEVHDEGDPLLSENSFPLDSGLNQNSEFDDIR